MSEFTEAVIVEEVKPAETEERMTCECGMNILCRRQYVHQSHWKHKYFTGQISKDEYDAYEAKYKSRYKNLSEEKRAELQKKSRDYQRERSLKTDGAYYAKKRLDTIVCECGQTINKTYSKSHMTSLKHIHKLAGTVVPKRTMVRKPKKDIIEVLAEMIE
jgi:hypothetical protein